MSRLQDRVDRKQFEKPEFEPEGAKTLSGPCYWQLCDAAHPINKSNLGDFSMIRCLACAFTAIFKSGARLVAENLCLRQQLIVLKRRQARPQLRDADRRFWILTCQLFSGWSTAWDRQRAPNMHPNLDDGDHEDIAPLLSIGS